MIRVKIINWRDFAVDYEFAPSRNGAMFVSRMCDFNGLPEGHSHSNLPTNDRRKNFSRPGHHSFF
jgi:hypothetical protein